MEDDAQGEVDLWAKSSTACWGLRWPALRRGASRVVRSKARAQAVLGSWVRQASSFQTASRRQWMVFSTLQWPRTSLARCGGEAWAGLRLVM